MRSFCIVVQRGHEDLYDALRQAFRSRPGFSVVIDRRSSYSEDVELLQEGDRRVSHEDWGNAHFLIVESLEPFGK